MNGTFIYNLPRYKYNAILNNFANDIKDENGIKYLNGELALPGDVHGEVDGH